MPQITFKTTAQYQLPIIDICEKAKQPADKAAVMPNNAQNESACDLVPQKITVPETSVAKAPPNAFSLTEEKTIQIDVQSAPVIIDEAVLAQSAQEESVAVFNENDQTTPMAHQVNFAAPDRFVPRAVVCFSSDLDQNMSSVGVTFAQEAKAFQKKKHTQKKETSAFGTRQTIKIQSTPTAKEIPVITRSISGTRFIYDTVSLFNYCVNWCKSVYFGRVVLRAIHNTGTLLLIFPGKAAHYIQFVYKNNPLSEMQRQFQSEIMPADVKIFRSFSDFSVWMKSQVPCDA